MKMDRTKLSEQIRMAIEKSGLSGYRIAKETGISQSMISVFMSGKGMLSMKFLDRVADLIGLNVTLGINGNGKEMNLLAGKTVGGHNGENGGTAPATGEAVPAGREAVPAGSLMVSPAVAEPQASNGENGEG